MNEIVKKNGITFGVIIGLFSILSTTLKYVIDVNLFISSWLGFVEIGVYLIIAIVLLSKTKKQLGGIFSFKDAFTTFFIMALIGIVSATIFNIILFNFIDSSLKETIKEMTMKLMKKTFEKIGSSAIGKDILMELSKTDQFSIKSLLLGMLTNLVVASIFGLIFAAFFKTSNRQEI
jgi:Protein of unknown function (DUF4199)